jgi:flagellar biosynthesis protein FlhG
MKSIAISSGKGGVGKTTVAVNLALALGLEGKRVLLVDADLGLANIDIVAGVSAHRSVAETLDSGTPMRELLIELAARVQLLPASNGILRFERLSQTEHDQFAAELMELSTDFDVVLFDTGAGLTENVLFFSSLADEVLLVTTPEPTAMTDTYALIKILALHRNVTRMSLLVNKVGSVSEGSEVHARLSAVCQQFLRASLGYAGQIFRDRAAEQAVRARVPLVTGHRTSTASSGLLALASRFEQVFTAPQRGLEPRPLQGTSP